MSTCSACAQRRAMIASNHMHTALLSLCVEHQQSQERGRPSVTATLSPEAHRELKAMAKGGGLSMSRMVDQLIRAEHRRRQRPAGWGR